MKNKHPQDRYERRRLREEKQKLRPIKVRGKKAETSDVGTVSPDLEGQH